MNDLVDAARDGRDFPQMQIFFELEEEWGLLERYDLESKPQRNSKDAWGGGQRQDKFARS